MPYHWTKTNSATELTLWPHRSLPIRGFVGVFGSIFILAMLPLFGLIGTALLWGMLPFVLLTLTGLYLAFMHSYHTGDVKEALLIGDEETRLTHSPAKGAPLTWSCNTYWVRAQLYPSEGPVPHYLTLTGNGREAELGRFLSEDERKALFGELTAALKNAQR